MQPENQISPAAMLASFVNDMRQYRESGANLLYFSPSRFSVLFVDGRLVLPPVSSALLTCFAECVFGEGIVYQFDRPPVHREWMGYRVSMSAVTPDDNGVEGYIVIVRCGDPLTDSSSVSKVTIQ